MSLDLKKTFKSIALAGMVATSPMVANDVQAADRSASVTKTSVTAPETAGQLAGIAQDYSITNKDAIGFFLNIGPEDERDPKEFGLKIRQLFANDGFRSNFTYSFSKSGESSIDFYVNGQGYTGYGMDKIAEGYGAALKHAKHNKDAKLIASNAVAYNND